MMRPIHYLFLILLFQLISCSLQTTKYDLKVTTYYSEDYTYYESNTGRTYLSYWLNVGYNFDWDSIAPAKQYYQSAISNIGILFEKGILNTGMFRKAYLKVTGFSDQFVVNWGAFPSRDSASFMKSLDNYGGPILKIITYDISSTNNSNIVTVSIGGTIHKGEDGWGSTSYWKVTLMSKNEYNKNNWRTFINAIYDVNVEYEGDIL